MYLLFSHPDGITTTEAFHWAGRPGFARGFDPASITQTDTDQASHKASVFAEASPRQVAPAPMSGIKAPLRQAVLFG